MKCAQLSINPFRYAIKKVFLWWKILGNQHITSISLQYILAYWVIWITAWNSCLTLLNLACPKFVWKLNCWALSYNTYQYSKNNLRMFFSKCFHKSQYDFTFPLLSKFDGSILLMKGHLSSLGLVQRSLRSGFSLTLNFTFFIPSPPIHSWLSYSGPVSMNQNCLVLSLYLSCSVFTI